MAANSTSKSPSPAAATAAKSQRQTPSASVRVEVWTRAAGRCQLCNEFLLEATKLGHHSYRRGEMAHIVGQSNDPRSPRTDSPLTKEQRENPGNFMLLCQADHDTIDHKITAGEFTIAKLHELKRAHEAHIKHVTGLPRNQHTCVVRVFGTIRGKTVQLSRQEGNETTLRHAAPRFAQFDLDYRNEGAEIDLTHLGNPEDYPLPAVYWTAAQARLDKGLARISEAVTDKTLTHLSIFPFARMPALIYFGFELGNKLRTTVFERHREPENEWCWKPDAPTLQFAWRCLQTGTDPQLVALLVNISGTIPVGDLPPTVDARFYLYELSPVGVTPTGGLVESQATLGAFRTCYRQFLGALEQQHKAARQLYLFPTVPLSVAVTMGLDLMPDVHPALLIYDRCPTAFHLALTINAH